MVLTEWLFVKLPFSDFTDLLSKSSVPTATLLVDTLRIQRSRMDGLKGTNTADCPSSQPVPRVPSWDQTLIFQNKVSGLKSKNMFLYSLMLLLKMAYHLEVSSLPLNTIRATHLMKECQIVKLLLSVLDLTHSETRCGQCVNASLDRI